MGDYLLRDIPQEVHRQAKAQAALEGISLRELILKAIKEYLKPKPKDVSKSKDDDDCH